MSDNTGLSRESFTFPCDGKSLVGSIDHADSKTGLLIVTGGSQTRFGSHGGFAQLAQYVAAQGDYPVMRYDRRGVGDSSGSDGTFESGGPDLAAAVAAFRAMAPDLERIVGFGLCDGATTLCVFGADAGIDAMILANPWVYEPQDDAPAPAAISQHYRQRMLNPDTWKRALTGGINYRKAISGVSKIVKKPSGEPDNLAARVGNALAASDMPAQFVIATGDGTGIAFEHEWRKGAMADLSGEARFATARIDTDAHSFAHEGDFEQLAEICLAAMRRFESAGE